MSFPIDPVINDELKVFEDEGKAVMVLCQVNGQ